MWFIRGANQGKTKDSEKVSALFLMSNRRSYFLKLDEGINKPSTPVQQPNGILHEETVIEPVPEIYQQNHCASMVLDDDETDDFKPNTSPTFTSNMPATRRSTRLSSQSPGKALQEPSDITPMQPVKTLRSNLSMQPQASQSSSASTPRLAIDKLEGRGTDAYRGCLSR